MNAERQLIGSLLIDPSRLNDMTIINSEMFTDSVLSKIFSIYEHAEGEVNQLNIVPQIISDFMTSNDATKLLADLINEHDSGISDKSCADILFDEYRSRVLNDVFNRTRIDSQNVEMTLDDLKGVIDNLQKPSEHVAKSLSELTQLKKDYFVEKTKKPFYTGFDKIDKAIGGVDEGDIVIIAARPGIGKSALALQFARKFGKDGFKVGYFNLEMAEKQIYERSIAAASGIDMTRIRLANNFLNDERVKFEEGNEKLKAEKNCYVITGTQSVNTIRAIQNKEKYDVIIIDYMQLLQPAIKRNNRAAEVGDISRGIKAIATDFKIPVFALSQLNRASELNKDKEPSMSELRESGDIEQDASVILMLWNNNLENSTEKKIKVDKSRNGYTDRISLYFDGKHMSFSTIDTASSFRDVTEQEELPWN